MLRKEKLKVTIVLNVKFFLFESVNAMERLQKCREITDIWPFIADIHATIQQC